MRMYVFIASLLCVFFACHMTEIIMQGKLYRAHGPLYRISEKVGKKYLNNRDYIFDKKEYYKIYHRIIAENLKIKMVIPKTKTQLVKGTGDIEELSKKEFVGLLSETINYLSELQTLEKRSACPMDILEYICYFMECSKNAKDPKGEFEDLLNRKYPELHYDSQYQSIMGAVNGENIALIVDDSFEKMSAKMRQAIRELPAFYALVKNRNASADDPKSDDWDLMTYGQLMAMCNKSFNVPIEQRYKGLGESDASMIFPSLMNPKTRKLIRITMDDVAEAMKTIELLHGDSDAMREARRRLLYNANITLEDIDN